MTVPGKTSKNKPKRDQKGRLLPGSTANPNGRPQGAVSIVDAIRRKLEETYAGGGNEEKRTYLEKLIEIVFKKAITDEDTTMLKDIVDRIDGKPQQKTDITSAGEKIEGNVIVLEQFDESRAEGQ